MFERDQTSTVLTASPETPNPIHETLDRIGFPFRVSVETLIARYGLVHDSAYDTEKTFITPCPFGLTGLIRPFAPQMSPKARRDLVPLWFTAMIGDGTDAKGNLALVHEQFARYFGPAKIGRTSSNTLGCGWRAGPASLTLTAFPPRWQSGDLRNDAHEREPRLATACSVSLDPGVRQALDEREMKWLETARPIAKVSGAYAKSLEALWAQAPWGNGRDFMREPVAACVPVLGQIAVSEDEEALIVCSRQLFIVPRMRIRGLELQNILPAKGSGGAYLSLTYHGPSGDNRDVAISEVFGQNERLEPLAEGLAQTLGLNLVIKPEQYDC